MGELITGTSVAVVATDLPVPFRGGATGNPVKGGATTATPTPTPYPLGLSRPRTT